MPTIYDVKPNDVICEVAKDLKNIEQITTGK